jgi:hypothetical protein
MNVAAVTINIEAELDSIFASGVTAHEANAI